MPSIGERIGNYQLVEILASGAFGRVYRAEHTLLKQRQVAIKFLRLERLDNVEERNTFLQEAHFLDQLKHPALLPIIDVGLNDEIPYIITEYASNGTLRAYLQRQAGQPVELAEALRIIVPVSEALQYAHEHNIIHRDLKPENILFNAHNEALLTDFGIAVLLDAGTTILSNVSGTAPYMAPEQFAGLISPKCDQYALACIIYELLTGKRPFTAARSNMEAMWYQHAHVPPIPPRQLNPTLPEYVEAALLKALAKERGERHANVASFLTALCTEPPIPPIIVAPSKQDSALDIPTQPLPLRQEQHVNLPLTPNIPVAIDQTAPKPVSLPISPSKNLSLPNPARSSKKLAIAWYKYPVTIVSSLALICLLIIAGIWSITQEHSPLNLLPSHLTVTITITPASRLEQNNYIITGQPDGSIDNTRRQVPARIITITSPTQTATGNSTGSISARTASGTLTFQNTTGSGITLSSTALTGKDSVQVSFNGPIFIPATGSASVTGFAVISGVAGNIPAFDIAGSCCASGISVNNPTAFTGGQNAIPTSVTLMEQRFRW